MAAFTWTFYEQVGGGGRWCVGGGTVMVASFTAGGSNIEVHKLSLMCLCNIHTCPGV